MSKTRVGYFGGTFDPPHLGHAILAAEAKHHLELDKFRWIITPEPPHKREQTITPVEYRLEMLKLVVGNKEDVEISDVDIRREPPHFAADTVQILKKENPSEYLVYIIGEDSLMDLPDWYQPNRFLSSLDLLAVAPRPGVHIDMDRLEKAIPGVAEKIKSIPNVMVEISSSVIRERVRNKAPFEHYLIHSVAAYIKENQLYLP